MKVSSSDGNYPHQLFARSSDCSSGSHAPVMGVTSETLFSSRVSSLSNTWFTSEGTYSGNVSTATSLCSTSN